MSAGSTFWGRNEKCAREMAQAAWDTSPVMNIMETICVRRQAFSAVTVTI